MNNKVDQLLKIVSTIVNIEVLACKETLNGGPHSIIS